MSALLTFPPDAAAAFDDVERPVALMLANVFHTAIRAAEGRGTADTDADITAAALRWMPDTDDSVRAEMADRCRRALAAVLDANPDATPVDAMYALSTRLHNDDLKPRTAAEQQQDMLLFRCHRALEQARFLTKAVTAEPDVLAELERLGWAIGGVMTPQGEFARDQQRRVERRWRRARTGLRKL